MLRVLTLNLWARSGDWSARRAVLRRCLADLEPDVIAFQESVVLDGYAQVADLLHGYGILHQMRRSPDGMGISVASRRPMNSLSEMDLHLGQTPREFPAGALLVEVGDVLFVNHFPRCVGGHAPW